MSEEPPLNREQRRAAAKGKNVTDYEGRSYPIKGTPFRRRRTRPDKSRDTVAKKIRAG